MNLFKSPSALVLALWMLIQTYTLLVLIHFNSDMIDFILYNKDSMIQRGGGVVCCRFPAAGKTNKQINSFFEPRRLQHA